jgi:ADP-ribose pyrophosphatase
MTTQQEDAAKAAGITIVDTQELWRDEWLCMSVRRFTDRLGVAGKWSYAGRVSDRAAAVIVARNHIDELVLIKQFRIPFAAWVYEFPAGLVDSGESAGEAAIREMLEETGYVGSLKSISPLLASSAGMSTEHFYLVELSINAGPGAHEREGAEAIELVHVPRGGESAFLAQVQAEGAIMDGKVYAYLQGFQEL